MILLYSIISTVIAFHFIFSQENGHLTIAENEFSESIFHLISILSFHILSDFNSSISALSSINSLLYAVFPTVLISSLYLFFIFQ